MRIILKNEQQKIEIDLYDEYDKKTKITSMARTTGYTCTAGANILLNNMFNKKGVFSPELIGKETICYDFIIAYLKERGVNLKKKTNKVDNKISIFAFLIIKLK